MASAALLAIGAGASSASAAPIADACGQITQSELARALGLKQAQKRSQVVRAPGNTAGVIRIRCRALAWTGKKPSNANKNDAIRAGKAADVRLETWVPDESPFVTNWFANFGAKVKGLTSRARRTFVESSLDGRAVALPKYGTEHSLGFIAQTGKLKKVRAFWWSPSSADIVSINAVAARNKPLLQAVKRIAATVVPPIG